MRKRTVNKRVLIFALLGVLVIRLLALGAPMDGTAYAGRLHQTIPTPTRDGGPSEPPPIDPDEPPDYPDEPTDEPLEPTDEPEEPTDEPTEPPLEPTEPAPAVTGTPSPTPTYTRSATPTRRPTRNTPAASASAIATGTPRPGTSTPTGTESPSPESEPSAGSPAQTPVEPSPSPSPTIAPGPGSVGTSAPALDTPLSAVSSASIPTLSTILWMVLGQAWCLWGVVSLVLIGAGIAIVIHQRSGWRRVPR